MAQIDLNIKYTVNLSYNYIKALIWSYTSDLPLISCEVFCKKLENAIKDSPIEKKYKYYN